MAKGKPRCFVIAPIGDAGSPIREHSDFVLHGLIEEALPDFAVMRSDKFGKPEMITTQIFQALHECELAVADLTFLNPNVFYELAIRHMVGKPVVVLASVGTSIPFDNAPVNTIFFNHHNWESLKAATAALRAAADEAMKPGYKVSNPVTAALGELRMAQSGDSKEQMLAGVMARLSALESEFKSLESSYRVQNLTADLFAQPPPYKPPPTYRNALESYRTGPPLQSWLSSQGVDSPTVSTPDDKSTGSKASQSEPPKQKRAD
ncbi:MAG: hypothetical protein C0519_00570 [Hyphomicrobium sp.]|nr:hypothetical protein [Hyphomicrobium sp.]PPD08017.1 MAG: hypothetical protein CTY28_06985 [Hyphomicrobium sp.]